MIGAVRNGADGMATPRPVVLVITGIDGIETTAAATAAKMDLTLEIASTRAAALRLLERRSYSVVVMDDLLADSDAEGAELVWKSAGLAMPLQFSFALAGAERLERELRSAMVRRRREQELAGEAAAAALDAELKNAVTGFLLESQLALAEPNLPAMVEARLRRLAGIAERLRERLASPAASSAALAATLPATVTSSGGLRPSAG